jgi:catechol 2,3-dioxygenase-like lactoylglutathione lyase family enzyme
VLDHVQLAAPPGCQAAARAFYGALLGLCELERPPGLRDGGGAWFELGDGQLHIGVQDPFAPARKAHPAIRLADEEALEALAARLRAAGVDVIWDHRIPEVRRFYTADPWGNRLELLAGDLPNRPLDGGA